MSEFLACKQNKDAHEMLHFICFWTLVCTIFILFYVSGLAPTKKGELADPDCYMRLIRVKDLYDTGQWYNPVIPRSNAPHGERLHWTRPFDILLLLGAVPLTLFTDFESALFWWGVIISPVLLIATIVALQWSTRPIVSRDGPFLAGFIFVFQIIILAYYQAGRPDHHSLIVFVFVLSIGFTLRMITRPFSTRLCCMAGVLGGLSMWISVELIVSLCITLAVLGLSWLLENGDFLKKNLCYMLSLFVGIGLSLVFERSWHGLLAEEYDRLSIVHFTIIGFITLLWIAFFLLDRRLRFFRRRMNRFLSVVVGLAVLALAVHVCFPRFYYGPVADVDPRVIRIYVNRINELRPLMSSLGPLVMPIQFIGLAVVGFPMLIYILLKNTCNENRKGWIFISISSLIFVLLSLYQIRWSVYAHVLLVIPVTALMVLVRQRGPKRGFLRILKNGLVVLIFSAGLMLLGFSAGEIRKEDTSVYYPRVFLMRICEYLAEAEKWQKHSFRILAHIDFGPEILYRTQHEVIGTPYHRNGLGILDTYNIMTAGTDDKALETIQKRGIDLILLCPESSESGVYSKSEQASTFYQRLCEDMIPNWLRKVELPSELSSSFILLEIME